MGASVRGQVRVAGEPLAAVVCSDGRTVVRTGPDGTFSLEAAGPFVFITVPTSFATDRWFSPPDGDLTFDLEPDPQPSSFSFAQITDLHMSMGDRAFGDGDATQFATEHGWGERIVTTPGIVDALLVEIADRHPDLAFIVSTGDQTNNGTDEEFAAYASAAARSRLRVIAIPGNHDHNSVDVAQARSRGEAFGPGVLVTPYDDVCGPRWFSFDYGGVHFVVIDWTTHHMGLETQVQEDWVRADLACVDEATPVVYLTHDLMSSGFFERVGRTGAASFSGHWHTSRVVEADGALHVNTAPATFGGLDYAPAHYRIVRWDGSSAVVETVIRGSTYAARDTGGWTAQLRYASYRGGLVASEGLVIATCGSEETPAGAMEAFDAVTGERRWTAELSSAVKSAPCLIGDRVVATAVTGETVCADVRTGAQLWRTEIDDPLRLWTFLRPASDGVRVFVGDTARFAALDLETGSTVWSRDDLGVRGNITCHAHPIVADGTLVVAFAAQVPDMWGLDPATGATKWPAGAQAGSIYDIEGGVAAHLPRCPMSGFAADPDGRDVYVVRLGKCIDRISAADGEVVWSVPFGGWFNPGTPVIDGDDVFACEGMGTVWCLSRADGSVRWTTTVTEHAPMHMGPYRDEGGQLLGGPVIAAGRVIVACGDGRIVSLSRAGGEVEDTTETSVPIAASPVIDGSTCFVVGIDGAVRSVHLT